MSGRVYIAAPLAEAPAARAWRAELMDCGFEIVSTWHDIVSDDSADPSDAPAREAILDTNLLELGDADAVLALLRTGTPRATYAEIGYAIARGTPVVWLHGPRTVNTCIFDAHPLSHVTRNSTDAIGLLRALAYGPRGAT